jgi:hypothetical protein
VCIGLSKSKKFAEGSKKVKKPPKGSVRWQQPFFPNFILIFGWKVISDELILVIGLDFIFDYPICEGTLLTTPLDEFNGQWTLAIFEYKPVKERRTVQHTAILNC